MYILLEDSRGYTGRRCEYRLKALTFSVKKEGELAAERRGWWQGGPCEENNRELTSL